jgi:argininosuccinate lyase
MGSGALAGCALDVDRGAIARELGFARPTTNSLDAASDRDFALDYLYALSVIATHLSRLSEDFVLFASQEFGFIVLPDEFSTGSSLMPQKKNPDSWELIRGKSGRTTAALVALLATLKGLPTSYQRDLQEDKETLFQAYSQVAQMLIVATGAIRATKFNSDKLRAKAESPALLATEGADYLVRRGVPFRQAHDIMGTIVKEAEIQRKDWTQLPLEFLKRFSPAFGSDFSACLTVQASLAAKNVPGGTAPESVAAAIKDLRERLTKLGEKQ